MITANRFVYAITMGRSAVKIGITGEPNARVAQLQSGNPFKLTLAAYIESAAPTNDEFCWHRRLAKYRAHGEWFIASPRLVTKIVTLVSRGWVPSKTAKVPAALPVWDDAPPLPYEYPDSSIMSLGLSVRVVSALCEAGIWDVEAAKKMGRRKFLTIRGMGVRSWNELQRCLVERSASLKAIAS